MNSKTTSSKSENLTPVVATANATNETKTNEVPIIVDGNILVERKRNLDTARRCEPFITKSEDLGAFAKAVQGLAFRSVRQSFGKDESVGDQFDKLVLETGFAKSTVYKRIAFSSELIDKRVIPTPLLLTIEQELEKGEEPQGTIDTLTKNVDKLEEFRVIARKHGMMPPLANDKENKKLTLEQRLVNEFRAAQANIIRLLQMRLEIEKSGKAIDPGFQSVLENASKTMSAINAHPLIAAKFVPVDDEPGTEAATA